MSNPPIRFCVGVHLHQPVGNFDSVFQQHMDEVYLPFMRHARDADFLPLAVHVSGPLLEWMESHDARYLDLLGELVSEGKLELLLAGMYEPVLVALPREDRIEQIQWMREALSARFGVDARGLWLTERVWESELAADLHDAGVRYALVDDRHFLVSGFDRKQLHAPHWTETGGKRVALFPIDERLRYLIPFQPPEQTVDYLRSLRAEGQPLAVLADDGEKFGGWPGTLDWVYTRGWLDRFFNAIEAAVAGGDVQLSTFADAMIATPSNGLAYLGTASYREMEAWSLPPDRALRLHNLEADLGEERLAGPDGTLVRGSHWRNFMVKYPEANRMHKKMIALSQLCHERANPPLARRAIGRAQCNDAYWHGVFGGLYLPHLRDGIWRNLAIAERFLRNGETIAAWTGDIDCDGHEEIWIHSSHFSAILSPWRGGALEEWTLFADEVNVANTLTRRREASHRVAGAADSDSPASATDATPSIHDVEKGVRLDALPPVDDDDRALFVDRFLTSDADPTAFAAGTYQPVRSYGRVHMSAEVQPGDKMVTVRMSAPDQSLGKVLTFHDDGSIDITWAWPPHEVSGFRWFSTEMTVSRSIDIRAREGAHSFAYDVETIARSEKGLDRTLQGVAHVYLWPVDSGNASLSVRLARNPA